MNKPNHVGVENLRIYPLARSLEKQIYHLAKALPTDQSCSLGNDLRRSSTAVTHYTAETGHSHSYAGKLGSIQAAREAADNTIRLLETYQAAGIGQVTELITGYISFIKQSWGLTKYIKSRQELIQSKDAAGASDELVAARS